ncbi:MAG TPA: phosphatidate cytidylyltransferase [Gemmatimonadales bacterium]|nr:phosphatidate cytidylyltransferase [Gemmatimonadales bacterium]
MDANLVRRVGFALIAIPLALLLVWYGGLLLALLLAVAAVLGTRELFDLAARGDVRPLRVLGLVSAGLVPPIVYLAVTSPDAQSWISEWWPYGAALWLILLLSATLALRSPVERPLSAAAISLLAVTYTGVLPAFLVLIRHANHPVRSWAGAWLVFYPLVVTWVCDTAAMFGGRAFKGPKLAPAVSPGKTRSGSIAGVLGGLLVAPIFAAAVFPRAGTEIRLGPLLVIAGVLSVVGQVGDLVESLFKREAGVKDSSALIPGHGGVLDRFDSLYFVIPTAAALYHAYGVI